MCLVGRAPIEKVAALQSSKGSEAITTWIAEGAHEAEMQGLESGGSRGVLRRSQETSGEKRRRKTREMAQ